MNKNNNYEIQRNTINEIDQQIATLISERIMLTRKIIDQKSSAALSIVDPRREQQIWQAYNQVLSTQSSPDRIWQFVKTLIELNPAYPKKINDNSR